MYNIQQKLKKCVYYFVFKLFGFFSKKKVYLRAVKLSSVNHPFEMGLSF